MGMSLTAKASKVDLNFINPKTGKLDKALQNKLFMTVQMEGFMEI